ncbi:hypothetical protein VKT23_007637 [Stygiomarasmius scandens]|uniref:F-box domain-containing protein n=1 Tax=Marasmiellus scandens TaxID=2682957 RepID=A0ABR1JQW4_9AGAR
MDSDSECYISLIPAEILAEIFLFCLPFIPPRYLQDLEDLDESARAIKPHTALQLSHVCSYWRSVALSTSSLWSQIILLAPQLVKMGEPSVPAVMQWTKHYIQYSGQYPLEIVLQSTDVNDGHLTTSFASMWPLVTILIDESPRWGRLHLSLPSIEITGFPFPEVLPCLEFFYLHNAANYYVGLDGPDAPSFFAPRLKELGLTDVLISSTSLLDSPQLAKVFTIYCNVMSAFQILLRAQPTMTVDLNLFFDPPDDLPSEPSTCRVNTLILTSNCASPSGDGPFWSLLNHISSLPALRTVKLTWDMASNTRSYHTSNSLTNGESLISLFSRRLPSETSITTLHLKYWNLKDVYLIQILRHLPSLEHLTVEEILPSYMRSSKERNRTLSGMFLQAVQTPENADQNCLVPRLIHLNLSFGDKERVECSTLVDMIQSRRRSMQHSTDLSDIVFSRLERVFISVDRESQKMEDIEMLQEMDNVFLALR